MGNRGGKRGQKLQVGQYKFRSSNLKVLSCGCSGYAIGVPNGYKNVELASVAMPVTRYIGEEGEARMFGV